MSGRHPQGRRGRLGPAYLRLLVGILLAYAVIIVFGDSWVGGAARIVLLAYLAVTMAWLQARRGTVRWLFTAAAALVVAVGVAALVALPQIRFGLVGATSLVLTAAAIAGIAGSLVKGWRVDTATVLGVLCIYLLLALLFASLNQLLAAFDAGYLSGALTGEQGRPSAADLLYFSVITIATVGYGDITPASEAARAVSVIEALVGQLYLVSVVAIVVSGWRRSAHEG